MDPSLEDLVTSDDESGDPDTLRSLKKYDPKLATRFRKYAVDVSAGWLYYMPTFALLIEGAIGGMTVPEIGKSRLAAALVHAAVMRPIGAIRSYLPKRLGMTEDSPKWQKALIDVGSLAAIQLPVYLGILKYAGVDTSEPRKMAMVAAGLAFTYATAPIFGRVMDWWRDLHGIEPALYKPAPDNEHKTGRHKFKETYLKIMSRDILDLRKSNPSS